MLIFAFLAQFSAFVLLLANIFSIFVVVFYFVYNLYHASNKIEYLKSYRVKSVVFSVVLLAISYFGANALIEDNYVEPKPKENLDLVYESKQTKEQRRALKLQADTTNTVNVDTLFNKNILNIDSHYVYLTRHYQIKPLIGDILGDIIFERDDLTSFNRYLDLTNYEDPNYKNIGFFGVGYTYFLQNKHKNAIDTLLKINTPNQYKNLLLANAYFQIKDYSKSEKYFENALKDKLYTDSIHQKLVEIYILTENSDKLLAYSRDLNLSKYVGYNLVCSVLIKKIHWIDYYIFVLNHNFEDINIAGIFSAILICAIWFIFLRRIDIFDKETVKNLAICLLLGAIFSLLTFFISDIIKVFGLIKRDDSLLFYISNVGLIEELVKIIPLLILLNYTKILDEPFDFILYASISALGFATVENMLYFEAHKTNVIFIRALESANVHMILSSTIAYGIVKAKLFYPQKIYLNFIKYWFIAAIFHGLFDYLLDIEFYLAAQILFLALVTIWFIFINNTLNHSSKFTYQTKVRVDNTIVFLAVGLTSILVLEYFLVIYRSGIHLANKSLYISLLFSLTVILFLVYKITNLDLVNKYWRNIQLSPSNDLENPYHPLSLPFRFFLGNHIAAQNFVNKQILISPFWTNEPLIELMPNAIQGEIRDRIILQNIENGKVKHQDATWFIVKLKEDLHLQEYNTSYILIKMRVETENLKVDSENTALLSFIDDYTKFDENKLDEKFTTHFGYIIISEIDSKIDVFDELETDE